MSAYVVMIDVAFLGIPVEAENEEDAREQALAMLDAIAEWGLRNARVIEIEDDEEKEVSE